MTEQEILTGIEDFSTVGYKNNYLYLDSRNFSCTTEIIVDVNTNLGLGYTLSDGANNRILIQNTIENAIAGDVICLPEGLFPIEGQIYLNKSPASSKLILSHHSSSTS